ncbi:MAG: PAS domain-containing protein [Alphaproteobacteria bacterium]|nr:PAS domain-containing protein [Alphaproteobacteria bacterium]
MDFDFRGDPVLSAALEYWRRKRGARTMPARRDIDPIDMPAEILPYLQIIEVLEDGRRFRYRLIGTALVEAFGSDYSGTYPEEVLSPARADFIEQVYRRVHETKRPLFSRNKYVMQDNPSALMANRVYLPLSNDEVTVNFILGALSFDYRYFNRLHGAWGGAVLDDSVQYTHEIHIDD